MRQVNNKLDINKNYTYSDLITYRFSVVSYYTCIVFTNNFIFILRHISLMDPPLSKIIYVWRLLYIDMDFGTTECL